MSYFLSRFEIDFIFSCRNTSFPNVSRKLNFEQLFLSSIQRGLYFLKLVVALVVFIVVYENERNLYSCLIFSHRQSLFKNDFENFNRNIFQQRDISECLLNNALFNPAQQGPIQCSVILNELYLSVSPFFTIIIVLESLTFVFCLPNISVSKNLNIWLPSLYSISEHGLL